MNFPSFFKRRQVWVPTFSGFVLISLLLISITFFVFRNLATSLAINEPVKGQYLIVEGWLDESALYEALNTYQAGGYQYIITTGGPINRQLNNTFGSYAEAAASFILDNGFDKTRLIVIPTPASAQDRTFLSAVMVRDWFVKNEITFDSFDVFSGDVHAYRTYILYKMAFYNEVKIGIIAAKPSEFELQYWWQNSNGAKSVVTELTGLLWAICCLAPGKYGSHQEKWGVYESGWDNAKTSIKPKLTY